MEWYLEVLKKYAVFEGRARRKEYWMYSLITYILVFAVAAIGGMSRLSGYGVSLLIALIGFYFVATFIPGLAVTVRRLHDTGHSGWWFFVSFIPLIGPIVVLVLMATDSQPGGNQYGPNPKGVVPLQTWNRPETI